MSKHKTLLFTGENFQLLKDEKSLMVSSVDFRWNTIEASLLLLYDKLRDLGFTYEEGKVTYVEPEEQKHV